MHSYLYQADPIDAGTDNGFTFTSPNWPTIPKAALFRITNVYPSHPAGSFWYPDADVLPTIASFTFYKASSSQTWQHVNISLIYP